MPTITGSLCSRVIYDSGVRRVSFCTYFPFPREIIEKVWSPSVPADRYTMILYPDVVYLCNHFMGDAIGRVWFLYEGKSGSQNFFDPMKISLFVSWDDLMKIERAKNIERSLSIKNPHTDNTHVLFKRKSSRWKLLSIKLSIRFPATSKRPDEKDDSACEKNRELFHF